MAERIDVAIVGAGLVGCAFALQLAQHSRLKVALFERGPALTAMTFGKKAHKGGGALVEESSPLLSSNQRVVALGAASVSLLKDIGVFDELPPLHAHPYRSMHVWDENSNGELNFTADQLAQTELGFMVDAQACTQALQQQAMQSKLSNLSCYFDIQLDRLTHDVDGAQLMSNGAMYRARLVVGADGARSWVRSQAKIHTHQRAYHQRGIVAKIRTSLKHSDCAWQRFLRTGPVAALPVHDNYSSIVWSANNDLADELMALNDRDFSDALGNAFESRLGEVVEVGPRSEFALTSQQASSYIAPSLALIGDAAHSIHPLAGQGANLGFKDAICLAELLCQSTPEEIGRLSFLSAYQTKRRRDNEQTDWLMTALNRAYQHEAPLWLALRGVGMNWVNASRGLKDILAKQAMGL